MRQEMLSVSSHTGYNDAGVGWKRIKDGRSQVNSKHNGVAGASRGESDQGPDIVPSATERPGRDLLECCFYGSQQARHGSDKAVCSSSQTQDKEAKNRKQKKGPSRVFSENAFNKRRLPPLSTFVCSPAFAFGSSVYPPQLQVSTFTVRSLSFERAHKSPSSIFWKASRSRAK